MHDLAGFQSLQRALVEAGFATTLEARREGKDAVFSLEVDLHEQTPEKMASLSELTSANGFTFTVERDVAAVVALDSGM